jgi:hypothetical protein
MADTKTKFGAGTIFSCLTIVLALVGMFIYIANATTQYYNDLQAPVIFLSILAVVLEVVYMILSRTYGEKGIVDFFLPVAGAALAVAAVMWGGYRAESAGITWGSNLNNGNVVAVSALNQALAGVIILFLAMVSTIVGAFTKQVRKA